MLARQPFYLNQSGRTHNEKYSEILLSSISMFFKKFIKKKKQGKMQRNVVAPILKQMIQHFN